MSRPDPSKIFMEKEKKEDDRITIINTKHFIDILKKLDCTLNITINLDIYRYLGDAIEFLFSEKIRKDEEFAARLWGCMVNLEWYRKDSDITVQLTFRSAADLLSEIKSSDSDYMDYYDSSEPGVIDKLVVNSMSCLGWYVREIK